MSNIEQNIAYCNIFWDRNNLEKTQNNGIEPLICVINLEEILYLTKRRFGDAKKIEILGRIHQLSFSIIPATNDLAFEAAEIKADYPISYADSFAVACAKEQSAEIVTGDPDFKKVAHLVKIHCVVIFSHHRDTESTENKFIFGLQGDDCKPKPISPGGHLFSTIYQHHTVGYQPIATKWLWVIALPIPRTPCEAARRGPANNGTSHLIIRRHCVQRAGLPAKQLIKKLCGTL